MTKRAAPDAEDSEGDSAHPEPNKRSKTSKLVPSRRHNNSPDLIGSIAQGTVRGTETNAQRSIERGSISHSFTDVESAEQIHIAVGNTGQRDLSNLNRIQTALEGLQILEKANYTPDAQERLISTVFDLPPRAGRSCSCVKLRETGKDYWTFKITIKDTIGGTSSTVTKETKRMGLPYTFVPKEDTDAADQVVTALKDLLNRWPLPLPKNIGGLGRLMTHAALLRSGRGTFRYIPWPSPTADHGPSHKEYIKYKVNIPFVDANTGAFGSADLDVWPATVMGADIPEVPDRFKFVEFTGGGKMTPKEKELNAAGDEVWPSGVDPDIGTNSSLPYEAHAQAAKFARFLSFRLSDMITTKQDLNRLRQCWQQVLVGKAQTYYGIYNDRPLYAIWPTRASRIIRISASTSVQEDNPLKGREWPTINIRGSLNVAWTQPVCSALIKTFIDTGDAKQAFIAGAEIADIVNAQILAHNPPSNACFCDEAEATRVLHACGRCLRPTLCSSRTMSRLGAMICKFCQNIEQQKGGPGLVGSIIESRLRHCLRHECRQMNQLFESPANQAVFDGALKKLNESITGIDSYIDGYRQKQIKIRGASGEILPNGHPQIPSVEAVFPYVPYWNEHEQCWQLRYHCANNVIITAAAINRFKFTSLPAVLSDIQQFRTTKKTADDRRELLKTLDKRHEVRCKVPFKQSARLSNAAVDADRVEQDIAEFKLGVPVDDPDGPWRQGFSRRIILRPAGNVSPWDQEEISILLHIVGQIELKFKMTLPRAGDGAPWIGTVDTMPEGWGWCMWFRLCAERLQRMKLECNKYWSTEDTETTLFLEIVYQYCSDEKQYEDFLGLPLTVYLRHPCNLSVGHRRHKQAMRTGWRSNPTSLDDRDEARNNILIETWTSNVYKFEYDEEYYPELHEMADQIEISSDHFNQQALEVRFIAKDDALQFAQASHHNAGEYRLEDDEVEELSHGEVDEVALAEMQALSTTVSPDRGHAALSGGPVPT